MAKPKRIVIWSDIPSHHQAPWIKLLSTVHGYDLTYVVMETIEQSERASQGWSVTDLSMIDLRVMPPEAEICELVAQRKADTLHVITGGFAWPTSRIALKQCLKTGADFAILAEPPYPYSKTFKLKNFLQKCFCRLRGDRVKAIWAIGTIAYDFYRSIGYPDSKVFRWAYFPPVPDQLPSRTKREVPEIAYVGTLNERKGVDLLVEALGLTKHLEWTARLVGGGPLEADLKQRATELGILDRITFDGYQPYQEAMVKMANSDLVLVPSRHDGWGAVVNEALGYGLPVICTDRCGAQDFLVKSPVGSICKASDAQSLAAAMESELKRGIRSPEAIVEVWNWAKSSISPEAGAAYFDQLVRFAYGELPKPERPWAKPTDS